MPHNPAATPVRWWRYWPFRVVCLVDVIVVLAIVAIFAIPALAATAIPIPGTNVVIDVGDIPPWIGAFVLCATFWEARKAKRHAAEAALAIKEVRHQTDGMLETMKQSAEEKGKQKAVAELAVAKEVMRTDLVADAKAAAEAKDVKNSKPAAIGEAGKPLPVADDRTAMAGERVAAATERSADAQQNIAKVAEEKK